MRTSFRRYCVVISLHRNVDTQAVLCCYSCELCDSLDHQCLRTMAILADWSMDQAYHHRIAARCGPAPWPSEVVVTRDTRIGAKSTRTSWELNNRYLFSLLCPGFLTVSTCSFHHLPSWIRAKPPQHRHLSARRRAEALAANTSLCAFQKMSPT